MQDIHQSRSHVSTVIDRLQEINRQALGSEGEMLKMPQGGNKLEMAKINRRNMAQQLQVQADALVKIARDLVS